MATLQLRRHRLARLYPIHRQSANSVRVTASGCSAGESPRTEFTIWGHDDFEVYEARENGLPDYEGGIGTREFLRELADHLEADKELAGLQDGV